MLQVFFVAWQELLIVSQAILLQRLQLYAVRGIILDWFVLPIQQETEGGIGIFKIDFQIGNLSNMGSPRDWV